MDLKHIWFVPLVMILGFFFYVGVWGLDVKPVLMEKDVPLSQLKK